VYRVLAAPIINFDQPVGTLVLGQRVTELGNSGAPSSEGRGLRSALWVNGRLVGGEIPDAVRASLTRKLLASEGRTDGQFEAEGTRYRFQRSLLNPGSAYPQTELISTFSMAAFDQQQRVLAQRIALIGAGAAMLAGLFALALSRQLARPIGALVRATREIRAGNYDSRLGRFSTPEIDTLSESFNEMAAGLALKDRYHSVLQQVADPQVAEGLIAGRVKLGGELREVTVMFCDIRGYTALTVGRDPEVVIRLLNHHMSAMTRVVQQHHGVINQFAGDSIMALFGAPKSYGDDTARAVQCARALIHERDRLNLEVEIPLRIGIGIATGPMVAGCIGAENRSDYTVVGERVNLAARLCSSAAAGEVLIDATTRERLGTVFTTEPVPPLTLKGFSEPIAAHRVSLGRTEAA
jgi:class 3 adenylate cyclase